MRTAIVSDLHLGSAFGEDLLRDPRSARPLLEEIAGADRLVLLGDVLELRELPLPGSLDAARPFFEELGEAMARREVLIVPGNHDHRLAEPLLERLALARRRPRSGSSSATTPPTRRRRRDRTLARAGASCASPTPASGCATTSTPPTATTWTATCACRGSSASPRRP